MKIRLFELFLCHPSHKIYFYYFLIYLLFLLLFIKYFYTCKCFLWRNKPTYLPKSLLTNIQKHQNMLKIGLLFKKLQTSRADNSRILRFTNAKFLGYCFYMNTKIQVDFQICISVPLPVIPLVLTLLSRNSFQQKFLPFLFVFFFTLHCKNLVKSLKL